MLICSLLQGLEQVVHGRGRNVDSLDETYLGVHEELLYARKTEPVEGNILGHYLLIRKYTFGCPYNIFIPVYLLFFKPLSQIYMQALCPYKGEHTFFSFSKLEKTLSST